MTIRPLPTEQGAFPLVGVSARIIFSGRNDTVHRLLSELFFSALRAGPLGEGKSNVGFLE